MAEWRIGDARDLATALRTLREREGLTQEQLAEWLGVHRNYVAQLEHGELSVQVRRIIDAVALVGADVLIRSRSGQ